MFLLNSCIVCDSLKLKGRKAEHTGQLKQAALLLHGSLLFLR